MKVSVVVPLYNKAPWVRRALDSIAAQTFRDFEVVVVDDGSTDGGGEVVRQYPDPRFRLVQQPNSGPGAARNRGIAEARGQVVAFLDADDEWLPGFLERSLAALEAAGPQVRVTVCGYVECPSGISRERQWRRRGIRDGVVRSGPDLAPMRLVHRLAYMNPWATVAHKEVLERYGGFFGRTRCLYGEDSFLWLQVLLNQPVLFRTEPLVRFHTEASALSRNYTTARQVEPFLLYPEELESTCPRALRPLLREVLSIRASKTACMLAYWGRVPEATALLDRFSRDRTVLQPWSAVATLATTSLGAAAGRAWRSVLGQGMDLPRRKGEPGEVPVTTDAPALDAEKKSAPARSEGRAPPRHRQPSASEQRPD